MSDLTPEQKTALRDAADILETEGNQLAEFLRKGLKAVLGTRLDDLQSFPDGVPHRVTIAIRNEMERVRSIAKKLRVLAPKEPEEKE